MNIKIKNIVDAKDLEKERIVFNVIADDFLGAYLVFKSKKTGEKTISSALQNPYWFPDKEVKKGDLVVLYTKSGTDTEKKNEDGSTTYFFYMHNLKIPLWNNSDDVVVLSQLENWSFKMVSKEV